MKYKDPETGEFKSIGVKAIGTQALNSNSDSIENTYSCDYINKKLDYNKSTALWQNSKPTTAFASQQIQLTEDIHNYEYYEILFKYNRTTNEVFSTGRIPTDNLTFLNVCFFAIFVRKITALNGASVTFDNAYYSTVYGNEPTNESNGYMIPIAVIGHCKKVGE